MWRRDGRRIQMSNEAKAPSVGSSVASPLSDAWHTLLARECAAAGGWLPFDRYMELALYAPGMGYYANGLRKFGQMPASGSDFVTAPELTPLFARTLARQLAQALQSTATRTVWEFGAGSGALALGLLQALDALPDLPQVAYRIVELSAELRARQQERLAAYGERVQWVDALPDHLEGVVIGNEVLDAMPVKLLHRVAGRWHERGVVLHEARLVWADRPTDLRPPVDIPGAHDYLTEIHPQAEAFVRTLADRLRRGAAFFLDYGFPESEYYHPQRHMGTLICHRGHRAGGDPLHEPGQQDITAHVNFTGVAVAAQEAGLAVLGYATQGRFLLNAGLLSLAEHATTAERVQVPKLVNEHEMGELFKVLALAPQAGAADWLPLGFASGDRTHTL